jgi:hypothetical protein
MKKKIATLLVTVAMAGALFAGPALAWNPYYHRDANFEAFHHPRQVYAPVYGPRYGFTPMMPRLAHWRLIGGRWHWVRG